MDNYGKLRTIKAVCWLGVAADCLWTVALVHPDLFLFLTGRPSGDGDLTIRLVEGIGASLMAGWTLLLAWTAREPIERRAVLAFTAMPLVAGYFWGGSNRLSPGPGPDNMDSI